MPIRSSVCAYSPMAAAGSSKYLAPSSAASRYSASSGCSSVLPTSSLSYGQYKPLSSSNYQSRFSSSASSSSSSSASSSPLSTNSTRYGSSSASSSSYSPISAASSRSQSSAAGLYRPLATSNSTRSSFNAGSTPAARPGAAYTPASRYSASNTSLSSSSSDYLRSGTTASGGGALTANRYGNQSSSAYSSASSSSLSSGGHFGATSAHSSPRARRLSYTSYSSLSSLGSYQTAQEPLPDGVPNGLVNLGNTCYMNATLQALYSIESFRNLVLSNRRLLDTSKELTSELKDLFQRLKESSSHRSSPSSASFNHSSSQAISASNLRNAFARNQSKFSGSGQQDAQEFLRYLINGVHEESNKARRRPRRRSPIASSGGGGGATQTAPKTSEEAWSQYKDIVDDSALVDLLVGQLCSTITCSQCQNKSHCWDPFWDLSLPLADARGTLNRYECNLLDLLNEFTARETLDANERPVCERCKCPTRSTKQISLARLPQVLILHLKKFTNDGYKLSSPDVKIETVLRFNDNKVVYDLKACVSHHGHSSCSGHYTSHCEYSTKWFQFDDDRVRDVSTSFSGTKLNDAYVLFYTKQTRSKAY